MDSFSRDLDLYYRLDFSNRLLSIPSPEQRLFKCNLLDYRISDRAFCALYAVTLHGKNRDILPKPNHYCEKPREAITRFLLPLSVIKMLLIQIRDYIFKQKEATLTELAIHFQMPESAIETMVDFWCEKKVIEKIKQHCDNRAASTQCGDCSSNCSAKINAQSVEKTLILYRVLAA